MGCEAIERFLANYKSAVKLYTESVAQDLTGNMSLEGYMAGWLRADGYRQQCITALLALQSHIDQHGCARIGRFELTESVSVA